MEKTTSRGAAAKWTLVLAVIAAALALGAAVVGFVRAGEVRWPLILAAVLLLLFGFTAKRRLNPRE